MDIEVLAAAVLLAGIIAYVVFGGADFGGGVLTALARGPRSTQQREAIFRAMGPVWETNHVWLILIIVTLFTVFPPAFAALFSSLFVPLTIALIGIVFRGAAFAFRHFADDTEGVGSTLGFTFSIASIVAPFAMGLGIGAIAGGHIAVNNDTASLGASPAWFRLFPIVCGITVVALCGLLMAGYMIPRTVGQLQEDFRKHGLVAGLAFGALGVIALAVAPWDASLWWERLLRPLPFALIASATAAWVASLLVFWQRRYSLARVATAAVATIATLAWAAVQYPYLILPNTRISEAATESLTISYFLVTLGAGALVLIPSLMLLYHVFGGKTSASGT